MSKTYKWGIIGTGNIAHQLADALSVINEAALVAVHSRKEETAVKFAKEYGLSEYHTNIDSFCSSNTFDIVYIATPHPNHYFETICCLNAGKHVLCEKPMALNYAQVSHMIDTSIANNCFLMEAMWTQFFPAILKINELIREEAIGEIKQIEASFCFCGDWNPQGRHLNRELAGGALLDVGIYPIYFAQMIMNEMPFGISSQAHIGETGVDEQSMYLLQYSNGALASLASAVRAQRPQFAYIYGTKGTITIPKFWQPDNFILQNEVGEKKFNFERFGNGYTRGIGSTQMY